MSVQTINAKEIASVLGVDPKALRRFIRQSGIIDACGAGSRYNIPVNNAKAIIVAFQSRKTNGAKVTVRPKSVLLDLLADETDETAIDLLHDMADKPYDVESAMQAHEAAQSFDEDDSDDSAE